MISLDWILLGLRIITTGILYTFLGIAFYIIWRALKQVSTTAYQGNRNHAELSGLRIIVPVGGQWPEAEEMLPLQPVTMLGRNPDNTIVVDDVAASNQHARISRENGVWWLEDLGSKNGTTLNELPLSKPTTLVHGDVIGIGDMRFRVELG